MEINLTCVLIVYVYAEVIAQVKPAALWLKTMSKLQYLDQNHHFADTAITVFSYIKMVHMCICPVVQDISNPAQLQIDFDDMQL